MQHHLKHVAMCAPMILLAAVLLAAGAGFAAILPVLGCVLMMSLMMGGIAAGMRRRREAGRGH